MLPHQRAFWELPNFIKVLVGGFGAGKTNVLGKWGISGALEHAPAPIILCSPTFALAYTTTIPTLHELLAGKRSLLGRDFVWTYNANHHEYRIRYHGRRGIIWIKSSENPDSLRGPNVAAVGIDEPFIQPIEAFNHLMARIRHPLARREAMGMALTGTPEQLNWGYELCVGELKDKNDVGVVRARSAENPVTVATGFLQRLESLYDALTAEAFLDAKFVSLAKGRVYYAFDPMEHEVELAKPDDARWGVGMDFNVNPMAMAVFWWIPRRHIHFVAEYELPNADTEFACSTLHDDGWYQRGLRDVFPDATGHRRQTSAPGHKSDFHYIREAGFRVNVKLTTEGKPVNPERKDRYNAVNGLLRPRIGKIGMTVSPKCKKLKRYLLQYSHELIREQEAMSHLLDAATYPPAYLFPVHRERAVIQRVKGA